MKPVAPDLARYFIAIIPPPPIFEHALSLKNYFKEKYHAKASLNSPPHITVQAPFLWNEKKESELSESLGRFGRRKKSFEVSLMGFGSFAPRVIFISVGSEKGITEFQKELEKFCNEELHLTAGIKKENKFHPHLTVAFRDLKKQEFDLAWQEFKDKEFSATFMADGFDLLKHDGKSWFPHHHFRF
ncbi:MAG TPA: 2'-5' RNA ligase family protein [Cyclobacteriaceae bacterium]|jgi:2'-5' RNA ligase|nr:2'-5' RNA ligase family protein [Cyclobacteriaceae bacterium]